MESTIFSSQVHLLKAKFSINRRKIAWKNEGSQRKQNNLGNLRLPQLWQPPGASRRYHHGQAVVLTGRGGPVFPLRCVLVHLLGLRVLPWFIRFGSIRLVLLALLTGFGLYFMLFIIVLGSNICTSAIKNPNKPKPSVIEELWA